MIKDEEVYKIGILNKPHGIHGEIVFTFSDDIFDQAPVDYLICRMEGILVPFFIEEYRFKSDSVALVKFEGIENEDQARQFTNTEVFFPIKHARDASPEERGLSFFVGFRIKDIHAGEIGSVIDVEDANANQLFMVQDREGKEVLIPAHEQLIVDVDIKHKAITMDLPAGLLHLDGCPDDRDAEL